MSFAWPQLLWLLFVPAIWLGWELTHRRRSAAEVRPKILRAEAGARSVDLLPPSSVSSRSRPRLWLTAGLALGILAVARPQWGRLEEPVFDQSREILLAIDLSRSMLTPDVKPSRLERAKLLIRSLLEKLEGERVGLVVFSGTAFLQSPLSADYEILREFLPNLGPDFLPEGGTNYRALLNASLDAFGSTGAADRFLIVLSDGEATDDDWKSQIEPLKKKGIRVIGLGVGTGAGAMIPDGAGGFVKDDRGAVVLSKLESGTLQELATATGGVYRDASSWVDLAALLQQTVEAGQKGKFVEKNTVRLVERFQWPLAFSLWCLLASLCYEFPVRPRPREVKLTEGGSRKPETAKAASTATAATLLLVLFALHFPTPGRAAETAPADPPAAPPPAPAATLSRIVGRLSVLDAHTARDWAELATETTIWGKRLQSEQQPVSEGVVRDALSAVELGSAADPKAADWPKLRADLEELLKKPEPKKDDQQKPQDDKQQQQQNQDQKNQDQQKQDSNSSPQDRKQSNQQQKQESSQQQKQNDDQQKPPESAFGDMKQKSEPPPPPQGDTQKVGGAPEKRPPDPAMSDPALAQPLQKLDQLRNEDSPAKLFQLMDGERKPTPNKKGKDW